MTAVAEFSELWTADDEREAVEARLLAAMEAAHAAEPGCIAWLAHRDLKAPGHLLVYRLFQDEAARAAHDRGRFPEAEAAVVGMAVPAPIGPRAVREPDQPVAIFVQCRIEAPERFDPSMTAHVGRTLAAEPGCLAFAWHRSPSDASAVQLYELYASREALSEHRGSEHLARFRGESEQLMLEARIHYAALALHGPLDRLLAFFGGGA
jgi:quinol monooxygenase YgiN